MRAMKADQNGRGRRLVESFHRHMVADVFESAVREEDGDEVQESWAQTHGALFLVLIHRGSAYKHKNTNKVSASPPCGCLAITKQIPCRLEAAIISSWWRTRENPNSLDARRRWEGGGRAVKGIQNVTRELQQSSLLGVLVLLPVFVLALPLAALVILRAEGVEEDVGIAGDDAAGLQLRHVHVVEGVPGSNPALQVHHL